MKNYKEFLLNKLIDSYEGACFYKNDSENKKNIFFRFNQKSIKEYYDETDFKHKEIIDNSCSQLEKDNFIKIIKGKGYNNHIIEKIQLNLDNVQNIYRFLNRKPKNSKENDLKKLLDKYSGKGKCIDNFIKYINTRINDNKSVKTYLDLDNLNECNDILLGLSECLKLKEEVFRRNFSVRVYGDSKRFEHIENKVIKVIKDFGEDGFINDYNIIGNYTYVYFKGDISFKVNNSFIDANDFTGGIAVSSKDIDKVSDIKVKSSKLFTIENLTTFNNFNEEGAVIYLGGFHNEVRRNLLKKIYSYNLNIDYYHFGDIDAGGFKILHHLRKKTGINFKPYMMNEEILEKYIDFAKDLTKNDRIEIERLLEDDSYFEFRDTLKKILCTNKKLEQEIIKL